MKKNDIITLRIEDMGVHGEGIGKADNIPLFVKDAFIGDLVSVKVMKMKKNYGYAKLLEILKPSKDRVTPKCEFHRTCGGCQIQALSYEKQLEYKERKVRNNLKRIGGFSETLLERITEPIIGMEEPYHYRNKAQFPIGKDREGNIVAGFYAGRTHTIIPNRNCLLGLPLNEKILDIVLNFMEKYHIEPYDEQTQTGVVRHVLTRYGFTTEEWMVCLIINQRELPYADSFVSELCKLEGIKSISININMENTNVILGKETKILWGSSYITDYIHLRTGEDWNVEGDGIAYQISPQSFYQVNPIQTEKLYSTALAYAGLTGKERVWDLYCGIGTISLFLARKAKKVSGVEIVPQAIADAKNNAKINGITNAEFYVGKAEEVLPEHYKKTGEKADVIVVDPPRKGCDEKCLETIVRMEPERVVYVSCDSATLARDLKYLCERGYQLERVRACDMFGHSGHVETVSLLSKFHADQHIEVEL
ncbi:MAG: 23S rRNA (uracil(1939)-C(5))-methyltransferase RlmD [Lachnospiraceae bacterium]|nr:23S rRNA (uracil(1939)-C(5))-methyltransferase RlmD [Lachnospiraceae bacterium]